MGFWPRATGRRLAEENKNPTPSAVLPRTLRSAGGMPSAASSAACSSAGGACLSAARNGGAGADGSECERRRGGAGRTKGRSEYHAPIRVVVRETSLVQRFPCARSSALETQVLFRLVPWWARKGCEGDTQRKMEKVCVFRLATSFVFSLRQRTTAAHSHHTQTLLPIHHFVANPGRDGASAPAVRAQRLFAFSFPRSLSPLLFVCRVSRVRSTDPHTPTPSPFHIAQSSASASAKGAAGGMARSGRLTQAPGRKPVVQKLDAEQLEELKEAFNLFDTDGNGAWGWGDPGSGAAAGDGAEGSERA